jgi:hypothetical protein
MYNRSGLRLGLKLCCLERYLTAGLVLDDRLRELRSLVAKWAAAKSVSKAAGISAAATECKVMNAM